MDRFASGGLMPDIYLVLDLPVEEGRARQKAAGNREDRLEGSGEGVSGGRREGISPTRSVRTGASGWWTLSERRSKSTTRVREVLRRELPETFVICED